jgi:EAL domain-containing protein (putative c-di-GMP-specific phosphodiesterase class I)
MDLRTGEIAGCEVLARWRDVDGSVVMPNRFIDIVERNGLALHFTDLLVQRAYAELSTHVPADRRMRVSFNIFPSNLDSKELALVFSSFIFPPNRFDVVVEIIESDEIPVNAQREIEGLRRLGIKTYIDDFGTGYSNMQNLAALSVDGVKLDRAFAMAPDNSMMAQMLRHAVEMIAATGRTMVVEGVETAERLELLRGMEARIDYVQGYYISRPLDIAGLVAFLASRDGSSSGAGKIPAVPQPQIAV